MRASQPARAWAGLVRLGFQLLYNDCAWAYDAVAWLVSEGQWRAWGQAAIPLLAGRQILEIGHGPGHLLLELAGGGYSVTGVDVSAAMGRIAGRRLARAGLSARLARARAQALPFPSRVFDSAVTTFPAAYIAEAATADEVRRVLRPGGRLVLVPAAGFKGNSLRRRAVNGLFALTGQGTGQAGAAEPGFWRQALAAYGRAGFKLDIRPTAVGDSRVTIITADLPD